MGKYLCNEPGCGAVIGDDENIPQDSYCEQHARMSCEDWRDACASFGAQVLRIMEAHQAWCADTMDEISAAAVNLGLATTDDNCAFRVIQ